MSDAPKDPIRPRPRGSGRHRAASSRRRVLVVVVAGAAALLLALGMVAALLPRDGTNDSSADPAATTADAQAEQAPSPSPISTVAAAVTSSRRIGVRGSTVTVVQRWTASAAAPVVLVPDARPGSPALRTTSLRVVARDGSVTPFEQPITVPPGGSSTVRGLYRLRACPDLVPTAWPTPAHVQAADRKGFATGSGNVAVDEVRTDEPLRDAAAICPGGPPRSMQEPRLRAASLKSGQRSVARVVLAWRGPGRLTVVAVGAPGGFPVDASGRCAGRCVALLAPGTRAALELRPVDGCPRATQRSDGLPLLVQRRGHTRLVSVGVPGLGRWFVRAC